mmetsp:Transcript_26823/g.58496  ORF Transcript_26823/g.58496 Transcript_26823/m.58496 type:complete len:84 (+) Transcript_26823:53-304(+)
MHVTHFNSLNCTTACTLEACDDTIKKVILTTLQSAYCQMLPCWVQGYKTEQRAGSSSIARSSHQSYENLHTTLEHQTTFSSKC